MSTRDSPGGKGGRCVRRTTYHPCSAERQEIRGLNLPGSPWAISTAYCGRDLYLYLYILYYNSNFMKILLKGRLRSICLSRANNLFFILILMADDFLSLSETRTKFQDTTSVKYTVYTYSKM